MKKTIAIIGGGFFGVSLGFFLSKKYKVEIFEKTNQILNGASKANQLRFHLGYHYPRSVKTLNEVQSMNSAFERYYGKNIFGNTENFYGVSKKNTKTTFQKYLKFLDKHKLKYKIVKNSKDFSNSIEGSIISEEKNLNYFKIRKKIKGILKKKKIKIHLKKEFTKNIYDNYYKVIIACYDQNNKVLKKLGFKPKKKFRFELVEKILIKLPAYYNNKSYMVLDGKFVSLDPYIGTKYHLLSDVKFSKLEIIKNYLPNFKSNKKYFLNKGIIKNIKHSKFKKFIKNSSKYLPFLKKAMYFGSFFVVRAIEIGKEKTDERLNSIGFYDTNKIITIFSGKWNTSIGLAKYIQKNKVI